MTQLINCLVANVNCYNCQESRAVLMTFVDYTMKVYLLSIYTLSFDFQIKLSYFYDIFQIRLIHSFLYYDIFLYLCYDIFVLFSQFLIFS